MIRLKRDWYKVLIVEDEAVARQGLEAFITNSPLNFKMVGTASDGMEALAKAEDLKPDLIITDIDMPKMDGIAFLNALRESKNEAEVIIISCYSHFSYAQKAVSLNVISYLLKPFVDEELHEILEKAKVRLESRRKSRQLTEIQRFVIKEKETILLDLLREAVVQPPNEELMSNLKLFGMPVEFFHYGLLRIRHERNALDLTEFSHHLMENSYLLETADGTSLVLLCSREHYSTQNMHQDLSSYRQGLAEYLSIPVECILVSDVFFSLAYAHEQHRKLLERQQEAVLVGGPMISFQTRKEIEHSMEFIAQNYHNKDLDLTMVADSVYMSPYYFSRLFNHEVGMSLTTYINAVRVEQACRLMEGGHYKIYEVSERVGFHSETYFNRIFKNSKGLPPKKYMQLQGNK